MKQITTKRVLNEEEYEFFKKIYKLYTIKELSEMFAITQKKVKNYLKELGAYKEEAIPVGMKKCFKCKEVLPLECFNNKADSRDGKSGYCKTCTILFKKELEEKKRQQFIEKEVKKYREKYKDEKLFCEKCNKEKNIDDYHLNYQLRNGKITIIKKCKECRYREDRARNLKKAKEQGYYA